MSLTGVPRRMTVVVVMVGGPVGSSGAVIEEGRGGTGGDSPVEEVVGTDEDWRSGTMMRT